MSEKGKKWSELTFKEKRFYYLYGIIVFTFLLGFSFFAAPSPSKDELQTKKTYLISDPKFSKKRRHHWVELYTKEGKYKINGIDYKYLKQHNFKKFIKKGVMIEIGVKNENIYLLKYKNFNFLRFNEAQIHKEKNGKFCKIVFGTGLITCLISYLFRKEIKYDNDGEKTTLDFGYIIIVSIVISIIIALIKIGGFDFVSGQEFMYE